MNKELQSNGGGRMRNMCTNYYGIIGPQKKVLIYSEMGEGRQIFLPKDDRSRLNIKDMSNYTIQGDLYRGRHSKKVNSICKV